MSDKEDKKFFNPIILPYIRLISTLEPTIWPLVIVKVPKFKDPLNQDIYALIDSGASNSILDKQIVLRMGIDLNKCKKYKNGRSVSDTYEFWVLEEPIYVKIGIIEFPVIFNVIDSDKTMWSMILGEDSIFKFAKIVFNKIKKEFEIIFRRDIN